MFLRVRVRGIYSTAISKILSENGIELIDVTPSIASRLKINENRGLPADVTVKTENDNLSQIMLIGFPEAVEKVSEILETNIPDMLVFKPLTGLYTTFKTRIVGYEGRECIALSPWGKAVLVDYKECIRDAETPATTIKLITNKDSKIVLSENIRIVGKYAILGRGSNITFSHFIRNRNRISELIDISAKYVREGYSIRWRSNADEANLLEIMSELEELSRKYEELVKKVQKAPLLEVVYEGESAKFYELTYNSKIFLDNVRKEVCPTIFLHHLFKSFDARDSSLVGLLDILSAKVSRDEENKLIFKWFLSELRERKEAIIEHEKASGKVVFMKGLISGVLEEEAPTLVLKRIIKTQGIYDGLNIPKEVGDVALTTAKMGDWHIKHEYFNKKGEFKGAYISFNTPAEILYTGRIRYIDLEVDLVRVGNAGCKLTDTKTFHELLAEGIITQDILEKLITEFDKVFQDVCSKTYTSPTHHVTHPTKP
ncbi:MAG: DUF402 domain-containing protein [Desulfurococcaceae archaeon TW002]